MCVDVWLLSVDRSWIIHWTCKELDSDLQNGFSQFSGSPQIPHHLFMWLSRRMFVVYLKRWNFLLPSDSTFQIRMIDRLDIFCKTIIWWKLIIVLIRSLWTHEVYLECKGMSVKGLGNYNHPQSLPPSFDSSWQPSYFSLHWRNWAASCHPKINARSYLPVISCEGVEWWVSQPL